MRKVSSALRPVIEKVISATFPDEYPMQALAGKTAQFDVKVTAVAKPRVPAIDEDFAKGLGAENLETLRGFARRADQA